MKTRILKLCSGNIQKDQKLIFFIMLLGTESKTIHFALKYHTGSLQRE